MAPYIVVRNNNTNHLLLNSGATLAPFDIAPAAVQSFDIAPAAVQSGDDLMQIDDKNLKRKAEPTPLFPFRPEITIQFEDDETGNEDEDIEFDEDNL